MGNKLYVVLLTIAGGLIAYLMIQNYKLARQVKELTAMQEISIKPIQNSQGGSSQTDPTPFDKPNVDPALNLYPAESPGPESLTIISFDNLKHDFGRISEGEKVHTVFKFKNKGKMPLIIAGAQGSCGCTVPQWPREPVQPGEIGEIYVEFDSHGKQGQTDKTVTVTANTKPAATMLTILATVIPHDK